MTLLERVAPVCAIWIAMMGAEIVHGALREVFLTPVLGDFRARQVSVLTGSFLVVAIACLCFRWLMAEPTNRLIFIGVAWVTLTLVFELSLGRLLMGYTWERIGSDYNVARGGFLPLGLFIMFLSPLIAAKLRRRPTSSRRF